MGTVKRKPQTEKARLKEVLARLRKAYPDARCSLDHNGPLELLIATILAAQCTDERVNKVTPALFEKYPTAADFAHIPQEELEKDIFSCGFYRNKAKSIRKACLAVVERFDGRMPGTMKELLTLDGVGRKTANVILSECFNTPGIIVDTHCQRLAKRLGFTQQQEPDRIEQDLAALCPEKDRAVLSHSLVFHGRAICQARAPKCSNCVIRDLCPFPDTPEGLTLAK